MRRLGVVALDVVAMVSIGMTLCACASTGTPDPTQAVAEAKIIQDCRQTATAFGTFSVHEKNQTWDGEKLAMSFEVKNIGSAAASLASAHVNSSQSAPTTARTGLVSESNTEYLPSRNPGNASSVFSGDGSKMLNPGATDESVLNFDAPKGIYTFTVTQDPVQQPNSKDAKRHPDTFACTVVPVTDLSQLSDAAHSAAPGK